LSRSIGEPVPGQTAADDGSSLPKLRAQATERGPDVGGPNAQIAVKLRQADILAAQGADAFRIAAYRGPADAIGSSDTDLRAIAEKGGRKAFEGIRRVGASIGGAITEMPASGRSGFLDHLKGTAIPEKLFKLVLGIVPALARRNCKTFHFDTREALDAAVHDGPLEQVPGFRHRRRVLVRAALAEMLARVRLPLVLYVEPAVELLLDVDREYRNRAAAGDLIEIAPKRFNPKEEASLPVLHNVRDGWHFTALYSNTARAHQLDRRYRLGHHLYPRGQPTEGRRTIITETRGEGAGRGRPISSSRRSSSMPLKSKRETIPPTLSLSAMAHGARGIKSGPGRHHLRQGVRAVLFPSARTR
jgi:hypothetical protein